MDPKDDPQDDTLAEVPPSDGPAAEPAPQPAGAPATGWVTPGPAHPSKAVVIVLAVVVGVAVIGGIGALTRADPQLAAAAQIFEGLPSDVQREMAEEITDIAAGRFKDLTVAEAQEESARLSRAGYARLDDDARIRRLELLSLALVRAPVAACGAWIRSGLTNVTEVDVTVVAAVLEELNEAELIEWYRLAVRAFKAEVEKSPERRSVSDEEFFVATEPIQASWTSDELTLIQDVTADPRGSTDADLCAFGHYLYGRLDLLNRDELAVLALYDIAPPLR